MESNQCYYISQKGTLCIKAEDKISRKLAMLFEGECMNISISEVARKYGYSRQYYYQVLDLFKKVGSDGIKDKKTGPKENFVRKDNIINQIIRYKFLDPDASADVIVQKLKQSGHNVSQRSVERTITEYGLQKKTPFIKSRKKIKRDRRTSN